MGRSTETYFVAIEIATLFWGLNSVEVLRAVESVGRGISHDLKSKYVIADGDQIDFALLLLDGIVYVCSNDFWSNRSIVTS